MIEVELDGKPVQVPERVNSWRALRYALGIQPGVGVAMRGCEGWVVLGADEIDKPGETARCWDFEEGQEYKTVRFGDDEFMDACGVDEDESDPFGFRGDEWWKNG